MMRKENPILILAQLYKKQWDYELMLGHNNALQFLACRPTTGSHGVYQQQDPESFVMVHQSMTFLHLGIPRECPSCCIETSTNVC